MSNSSIAIELYTLRDFLKTPADIASTLKRVKKIGYAAVELAGLGKIEPKELTSILAGEGLTCCGGHVGLETLLAEPQRVIDDYHLWNCPNLAVPWFQGKTLADYQTLADQINALAGKFTPANIRLGYHHHSHELIKFDGRTPLALLAEKLLPALWVEIDTYWLVHGGADPIQWITRMAGRVPCIHLKDMAIDAQQKQPMAEVGAGNLNWPGILAACQKSGVVWHVVEQDICPRDPFDCIAVSLRNLRELGLN